MAATSEKKKELSFLTQQALPELLPKEGTSCQRYLCVNIFMAFMAVYFPTVKNCLSIQTCIFL